MKWKVEITGDERYLEELRSVLDILNLDPKIYKEEEKYFFETSILKDLDNAKEIAYMAKTYLTFLFHFPHFKSQREIEAPRVEGVIAIERFEDRIVIKTYDQEGDLSTEDTIWNDGRRDCIIHPQPVGIEASASPSIIFTTNDNFEQFVTLENMYTFVQNNMGNKELLEKLATELNSALTSISKFSVHSNETDREERKAAISSFLSDFELLNSKTSIETLKWVILYKIFETMGGKHKLSKWCDVTILDQFACTANLFRHARDKNCEDKIKELGIMELSNAEVLVTKLLALYIKEVNKAKKSMQQE